MSNELSDDELLRYSRQILLPQFDVAGQLALKNARVLVVGVGGLGSPVAIYLAAAGVGQLVLVDDDTVEISNLQRQIAHSQQTIGQSKVVSAKSHLAKINSNTFVQTISQRLQGQELLDQVASVDVVVDCCDNFTTRCAINSACVTHRVPLVSGAAIRFEGQIAVFDARQTDAPCYQCLYGFLGEQDLSCSSAGVLSPVVGVIGAYQAMEAIKLLAGVGRPITGRVQFFDGLKAEWREFKLRKDAACTVCKPQP